jgi:hypothetical protein
LPFTQIVVIPSYKLVLLNNFFRFRRAEIFHEEILTLKEFVNYNRIPLIQHPQDWKGAKLSNILDYQTVPMLT